MISGHRLVLAYNLVHNTFGSHELGANADTDMSKLKLLFKTWDYNIQQDPRYPLTLGWRLEHKYTDASLGFQGLKGRDLQVVARLRQACEGFGFCAYLANFTRERSGFCAYDPEDEDDWHSITHSDTEKFHEINEWESTSVDIKQVVDLHGNEIPGDPCFDEDNFIQAAPFHDQAPDEEYYKGIRGNEPVEAKHYYRHTVRFCQQNTNHIIFDLPPRASFLCRRTIGLTFLSQTSVAV